MAMPPDVQMRLIKKRLIGKEGKAKLNEIREIEKELPKYNTGPYGVIRKWLLDEIKKTKKVSKTKHQDWLGVKKEGIRQFVLVGYPSVGKSSLIKKLSGLQTRVAEYAFTTLKPIPGTINLNGAYFQIVDLPGLIKGATEDVGGGKRLMGIVKASDGVLLMHDLSKPFDNLEEIVSELEKAEVDKPTIVIGNKLDLDSRGTNIKKLEKRFPNKIVVGLSTTTGRNIDVFKKKLWEISNLIRIFPKGEDDPIILDKGSTVSDFAEKIHKSFLERFKLARVSGSSAKFPNQEVGLNHVLKDMDILDLVLER